MTDGYPVDRIWQTVSVSRDPDGRYWLEFPDPSDCSLCRTGQGCGAASLNRLLGNRSRRMPLPARISPPPDRIVEIGVAPSWLLECSAVIYLLPVVGFVSGGLLAEAIWPGRDAWALIFALAFGAVALWVGRRAASRRLESGISVRQAAAALETGSERKHVCAQHPPEGSSGD